MGLKLITAPAVEPVTLAEAKAQLRKTTADEDALISSLIVAARNFAEAYTGRAFITQTWDYVLDAFPCGLFELPKGPLQSVSSVKYLDSAGVEQTLAAAGYKVDALTDPGRIAPAYGQSWPTTRSEPNAVTVRFVAGYGDASAVPQAIKEALLLLISHLFENREAVAEGNFSALPLGFEPMLAFYRVIRWA